MKILLKTQATSEMNGMGENPLPYCIVTTTPSMEKTLLRLRKLFLATKKQADTLWEMYHWQGIVDSQFYTGIEDGGLTDAQIEDLDTNDFVLLDDDFDAFERMDETGQYECEQLVVRDDAFAFFCYEKYSGAHVVSESIPFHMIEPIAKRVSKKRSAKKQKRA
jgi:hypothetical protein